MAIRCANSSWLVSTLASELGTMEVVHPARRVAGQLRVPGDKSIAHRALILSALADGESQISGVPEGEDVRATVACLRSLGVRIDRRERGAIRVVPSPARGGGSGWGPSHPHGPLDCANSGTTMRLLLGLLAGSSISATLDGDASLRRRPMARVIDPLLRMGAHIDSNDGHAPLVVTGARLQGRHLVLPVASAQVKSAILLAGLEASGPTSVVEPLATRDHTERLLSAMGAEILTSGTTVDLRPSPRPLRPIDLVIPGDFSSAAFWFAAAAMRPGWSVTVGSLGLNPTRTAFLRLLERMGAGISAEITSNDIEPTGSATVIGQPLTGIELGAEDVASAIDEIPALLVIATQAKGTTNISGASELRVKESDRIAGMAEGLRRMGASVEERADGISVHGPTALHGARIDPKGDHRIAMAFGVAGLVASGPTTIEDADAVAVSYPGFFSELRGIVDDI
jgi:3-phosphoshikimate 1-carboxyvinyltransferase